jgi:hypothetical protein
MKVEKQGLLNPASLNEIFSCDQFILFLSDGGGAQYGWQWLIFYA